MGWIRKAFAGVFTSWKTTVPAFLVCLVWALRALGVVDIPTEVQLSLTTIALALVGVFARDANKSSEGFTVEPM